MYLLKKFAIVVILLSAVVSFPATASDDTETSFFIGIGGGYSLNNMSISHIDKTVYPNNKYQESGLFDIFLQYEFGHKKQFGLRLEFDFLNRGGFLDNIYGTDDFNGFYESEGIKDISYKIRSRYTDIRLPLIYQFCNQRSMLRPYVYIAPMVCLSTGGKIRSQIEFNDGNYTGTQLDLSNGNMRSAYFAGAIGIGLKYDLALYGYPFYFALEANYQMGMTNTYSAKEMNGEAIVKDNIFNYVYDITGSRRFNGFEFKASLSVPLSVFSKKKPARVVTTLPISVIPAVEPEIKENLIIEPIVDEIPCRSIDEISAMIERGEDIRGVSFCSIDDIRFETGKSTIYSSSYPYLNKVASILKRTGVKIEVHGHTDNTGTPELNLKLSRERALAVVNYLKSAGVSDDQLTYTYHGQTKPISDNATPYGRSVNRRVEFEIK